MRRRALILIMGGSVLGLGVVTALGTRGPGRASAGARHAEEFSVVSGADAGPGTLREAIFAASLAPERARIVIRVPEVSLRTPLPPVTRPRGVEIVAAVDTAVIDAARLGQGSVLDLQAAGARLEGLRIRDAGGVGVVVRAPGVRVSDVECLRCGVGLEQTPEAEALEIEGGAYVENAVGVRLQQGDAGVAIRGTRFERSTDGGLWAVGPARNELARAGLVVSRCRFDGNRLGVVAGNLRAAIEDNDIAGSRVAGVYLAGRGVTLRRNRVRGGEGVGILAALTESATIVENEVDGNRAVGIVVSTGRNTVVQSNRIYRNGYGIVVVFGGVNQVKANSVQGHAMDGLFVVGSSPILDGNRALNNRSAGLRILEFRAPPDRRLRSEPLLSDNVLEGNGTDRPLHGVFREAS